MCFSSGGNVEKNGENDDGDEALSSLGFTVKVDRGN